MSHTHVALRNVTLKGKTVPKGSLLKLNTEDAAHLEKHGAAQPVDEVGVVVTTPSTLSVSDLIALAWNEHGVVLDVVNERTPSIAPVVPGVLKDVSLMTRDELFAEAKVYDAATHHQTGEEKLRVRVIAGREAAQKAAN
ncbi:hypothetical protein ACFQBQ_07605 [Granulicella cerasi]|uniref:Uncharacterized protein n=1 Tax=Granulicella cerasi TaxID=741063 RepID=A0ABW1Z7T5_9BACT|nr:hypothetical protein [Granulicella cerasi]